MAVLFADVCGSTARVARSDPEEARQYLDQALLLMKAAVAAYGGTISQTLGDGVLALFGAPSAHEDYVLRACLAGQDIQRRALEWNRGVGDESRSIDVRVGIDCGEVVVSCESEFVAAHYRADGVPVHVAKRLEQAAKPGSVLISGAAFRQIEHVVGAQPLGARRLEGISQDVEVYELALRSAVAPLAGRRHAAPMIGRQELLNALATIADQVSDGRMQCVGLRGEAGAGKSRLIVEFCRVQVQRGFASIAVSAHSYTSHMQYAVAADLMRALLQACEGTNATGRGALAERLDAEPTHRAAAFDLLGLGDPGEAWKALTPAQRRRRIAEALQWLLVRRASERPLLIVIEDLMRADRESVRLIEQVLRRLESLPVLLAVSYRDAYQPPWQDAFWFSEHWVRLLERREMQLMAREILGEDPSLDAAIDRLVCKADGNPFYFEQMAMTLIDDGTLVGSPGAYRCARPEAKIRIPASISVVIVSRVDRLPAPAKATLEAAAIAGEPLSVPVLAAMRGLVQADVLDHLAMADAAGLLQATGAHGEPMRFRHSLVQEVVARSLTQPRRKALHRAALSALRAQVGESPDQAALLAQHAFNGEAWAEAAHFSLVSMSWSIARSANREALEVFHLGMEAARRVPSEAARLPLELSLLTETLGALLPLGRGEQLLANLDRAGELARKLGDPRREAAVLVQYAVMLWTGGRYEQGLAVASQAESAATSATSRSLQMAAAQARMMLNHGLGRYGQVLADARDVEMRFAPELGARRIMAGWAVLAALNLQVFKAEILARADDLDGAQRACDAAYRELAAREHAFSRTLADFAQGRVWIEAGRYGEAAALLDTTLGYCRKHDVLTMHPPIFAHWCWAQALAGRAADAAAQLRKAIDDRLYLAGGRYNEFYLSHALAIALNADGKHEDARVAAAAALEAAA
ncbi:MAG: ATP-binding protein, partial [Burkholderiaceae bacterium]